VISSGTVPRGKGDAEIGEERARILTKGIDLNLPAPANADDAGSQAVAREAANEVSAGDAIFYGDEDGVRHYAGSSGSEPGRSE
jgi:hypothetical protein